MVTFSGGQPPIVRPVVRQPGWQGQSRLQRITNVGKEPARWRVRGDSIEDPHTRPASLKGSLMYTTPISDNHHERHAELNECLISFLAPDNCSHVISGNDLDEMTKGYVSTHLGPRLLERRFSARHLGLFCERFRTDSDLFRFANFDEVEVHRGAFTRSPLSCLITFAENMELLEFHEKKGVIPWRWSNLDLPRCAGFLPTYSLPWTEEICFNAAHWGEFFSTLHENEELLYAFGKTNPRSLGSGLATLDMESPPCGLLYQNSRLVIPL